MVDNIDKLRVSIVSGALSQAYMCYDYMGDIFRLTRMKEKVLGDVTMKRIKIVGGGIVRVLTASTKQTQAPRSDIVIIDEACSAKTEIVKTVIPQAITALKFKLIVLTTPDEQSHIAKTWWDNAEELGFVRYHWDAYSCKWIPEINIETYYNLVDESTFRIMMLGLWSSKAGTVFKYSDVQRAICKMSDLPPLTEMDFFSMGHDWGDVHPSTAVVLGVRGNILRGTDEWFVYNVKTYDEATVEYLRRTKYPDWEKDDIIIEEHLNLVRLYHYTKSLVIWSEDSPISRFPNRKYRRRLANEFELNLNTDSFSNKKSTVISNTKGTFEKGKIKIPEVFKSLIDELFKYHYKQRGDKILDEVEKVDDDHVDGLHWARWCIHPKMRTVEQVGALD